jgi:hypothetical protein
LGSEVHLRMTYGSEITSRSLLCRVKPSLRSGFVWLAMFCLLALSPAVLAQGDGARVFGAAPVGLNVLALDLLSIQDGNFAFDPTLVTPLAKFDTTVSTLQYFRTMEIGGRYVALFGILRAGTTTRKLPFGIQIDSSKGLTDPFIGTLINLKGLPALSFDKFRTFTPGTIVHLLLGASLPLGEYDSANVINLGSNRYTFRIGLPVIHTLAWGSGNRTTWETTPSVLFFTENKDKKLKQNPLFVLESHLTRDFGTSWWGAVGMQYTVGGATTVDGEPNSGRKKFLGAVLSLGWDIAPAWSLDARLGTSVAQNEFGLEGDIYHLKLKHRF